MAQNLKMTFGFGAEQDSTRNYNFSVDDSLVTACKDKILGINESLAASTDGGLADFFLADNGTDTFSKITYAEISSSETQVLDISGGASSATDDDDEEG